MKLELCSCPLSLASEKSGQVIPSLCHPNILPLFAALEGQEAFFLLQPYVQHTLLDVISFTPAVLGKSSVKQQFLLYQVLQGLTEVHSHGIPQNCLDLSNIVIDEKLWIKLPSPNLFISNQVKKRDKGEQQSSSLCVNTSSNGSQCQSSARIDLLKFTKLWLIGDLSNFDYLMMLNNAAGRQMGNPNHHPVIPWIMDFSVSHGGWRNLTKSKYRLNKGDSQLDFAYETTGMRSMDFMMGHGVLPPHHLSDLLSDITYYVYLARRTPKHVLCAHVRQNWVPNEYPLSIQRLQAWTPDECIPQFFTDPTVFKSLHADLPDLEVPTWADSPEDFIHQHRRALESNRVSENLHHWIDIAFGYKLLGHAAEKAKNVVFSLVDPFSKPKNYGVVQLFASPHPKRKALVKSLSHILMAEKELSYSFLFPLESSKSTFSDSDNHGIKVWSSEPNRPGSSTSSEQTNKEEDEPEVIVEYPAVALLDTQSSRVSPDRGSAEAGSGNSVKLGEELPTADVDARSKPPPFWNRKSSSVPTTRTSLINYQELPIDLPKEYNPLNLMEQLTSLARFGGNLLLAKDKGLEEVLMVEANMANRWETSLDHHIRFDLLAVAVLIIELLCSHKVCSVMKMSISETKVATYRKLLQTKEIPLGFALAFVEQVFAAVEDEHSGSVYGLINSNDSKALSPPQLLVSEFNEQLAFPGYFVALYDFLIFLVSNTEASDQEWTQNPVDIALERLLKVLPKLDAEGFDLLLPYLIPLFERPNTRFDAALKLFGEISKRLGPQKTTTLFLKPILVTMEQPPNPTSHARLMYITFIQKLIRGFGLQVFLDRFVLFLVDSLVGSHAPYDRKGDNTKKATVSQEIATVVEQDAGDLVSSASANGSNVTEEVDLSSGPCMTAVEIQNDLLSNTKAFGNLEASDGMPQQADTNCSRAEQGNDVATQEYDGENLNGGTRDGEELIRSASETATQMEVPDSETTTRMDLSNRWPSKSKVIHQPLFHQFSDQMSQLGAVDVAKVAMDTMVWLFKSLGPVLTSSHLVLPLLKSLTAVQPAGDPIALKNSPVMKMLMFILDTYGNHFFLEQFLPFAAESVKACEQRLTAKMEASLSAIISLIKHWIMMLPPAILINQMEMLSQQIFQRVISILSSPAHLFPTGSRTRCNICHQLLDTLLVIANQLGRETGQPVLAVLLQQFFSSFDRVISLPDDHGSIRTGLNDEILQKHEELGIHEKLVPEKSPSTDGNECVVDEVLLQLQNVFTPELAQAAYVPFCQLMGQINMRQMLYNADLIEQVSYQHIDQNQRVGRHQKAPLLPVADGGHKMELAEKLNLTTVDATHNNPLQPGSSEDESEEELDLSEVNFGHSSWFVHLGSETISENLTVAPSSNELDFPDTSPVSLTGQLLDQFEAARVEFNQKVGSLPRSNRDGGNGATGLDSQIPSERLLEGNWLHHWKNQLGSHVRSPFRFDQLKLQTYSGHTGPVRSLCALEGQGRFFSGSRDRTVKVWSLDSQGDGSADISCLLTYQGHKKTVLAVDYLERTTSVISCSASIHIWNPETAQCLMRLESPRSSITSLSCLPPPFSTAVIATADNSLRFVDVRVGRFMHDWRIQSAGTPRSVCVDSDGRYLIVGLATGVLTLLDVRTGLCMMTWKPHDLDISKIRATADKFVVASHDERISIWKSNNGTLVSTLKGHTEAVFDCQLFHDDIVSVTPSKLGIHTVYDRESTFICYPVKPDLLKSGLSALDLVPLRHEIIVATDSGQIHLLA
jgi:WD repeat-containing protein 81